MQLKVAKTKEALQDNLKVLRFFARVRVAELYPVEFEHVVKWVDSTLCALRNAHFNLMPCAFISVNKQILLLLLPTESVNALLAHDGAFELVEEHLVGLSNSSDVGMKLFGSSIAKLLAAKVHEKVVEMWATLNAMPTITENDLFQHRKDVCT